MIARTTDMTDLQKSIISYYDNTRFEYRVLWLNSKDRAVHFGYYDTFKETHSEALKKMNLVMAQKVAVDRKDHVLDAGCGQGGSAMWLAEHIGCSAFGVTLVPHQVEVATRVAKERKLEDKVKFFLKDYTDTGLPDQSFNVIWACESLCHCPEKKLFYKEAYRLLKPGGRLVIAEYIRHDRKNEPSDEGILQAWCSGWSMPDLDTWQEHRDHMSESGFVDIYNDDVTKHVLPSLNRLYRISKKLLLFGNFLNFIKIRNNVQHHNQLASLSQYDALSKNLWYYCICSAVKPNFSK